MICPALNFLVLFSLCSFGSFAQTSAPTTQTPQYSAGPVTDYSAAQPDTADVLRFRRGERYNIPDPTVAGLGETSEPIELQSVTHFKRDPLPFDSSDAVVVGAIKAGQAYLSNDKRRLYSEFKVELQDVIKTPSGPYLKSGDSIDVQREGGRVKLPSGKVLVRAWSANSMPQIGRRYLLFLKYHADTEDYTLLTGYQLEGTQVYRLDDLNFQESNHERVEHPLRGEGKSEDQFLAHTKNALLSRKKGS